MGRKATEVTITDREHEILEGLIRASKTGQDVAVRARIVLMSAEGKSTLDQAATLRVHPERVSRWRVRWASAQERLAAAAREGASNKDLEAIIVEIVSDKPRPGGPATFSPEQLAAIISLACENPVDSGRQVSHWTPTELAQEAIHRGIVDSISPRHVGRFLKEAKIKPHKSCIWLTSPDKREEPEQYSQDVQAVCDTYLGAPQFEEEGTHVVSSDEKTGMQALERKHPTLPVMPGLTERIEFEYIRHGTLCLMANWDVVKGRVREATIGPTRTEQDLTQHIEMTINTDPEAGWVFVVDQLNTHMSEGLVRLVAKCCGLDIDLGVKGRLGILKTKRSRKKFLADTSHRIRFVYTPRHCSWLNQVEIWFSILTRRLLKRSSFASLSELRERLVAFIRYFNEVLAKPFKWTYTGRPLQV
jgi:transposase